MKSFKKTSLFSSPFPPLPYPHPHTSAAPEAGAPVYLTGAISKSKVHSFSYFLFYKNKTKNTGLPLSFLVLSLSFLLIHNRNNGFLPRALVQPSTRRASP